MVASDDRRSATMASSSDRIIDSKLCKTAAEHPEILFLKVNFDENKLMCKNLNVKVLPYFHFYRGADGQLDSFSCSLAKIHLQSSMSNVDNSPQSLLAFNGNQNVHGLYDFLLNYRFLLTSLTSMDVPVLYSPVPFQNAALSCPEFCYGIYHNWVECWLRDHLPESESSSTHSS